MKKSVGCSGWKEAGKGRGRTYSITIPSFMVSATFRKSPRAEWSIRTRLLEMLPLLTSKSYAYVFCVPESLKYTVNLDQPHFPSLRCQHGGINRARQQFSFTYLSFHLHSTRYHSQLLPLDPSQPPHSHQTATAFPCHSLPFSAAFLLLQFLTEP